MDSAVDSWWNEVVKTGAQTQEDGAMARQTKAQEIECANEEQALEFFREMLASLPDPRRRQGLRYPLETVITTALMGMICGCDDAEALAAWSGAHRDWLDTFLPLPHGTPSQDVYLAVFASLDPEAFGAVLRSWVALVALRLKMSDRHIAIDGKTSRHSFDTAAGRGAIHTVSAFLSNAGVVLGQSKF